MNGARFRVWGSGFRVRVQGLGCRVSSAKVNPHPNCQLQDPTDNLCQDPTPDLSQKFTVGMGVDMSKRLSRVSNLSNPETQTLDPSKLEMKDMRRLKRRDCRGTLREGRGFGGGAISERGWFRVWGLGFRVRV